MWSPPPIMISQPGQSSGMFIIPGTPYGDPTGTMGTIPATGGHGDPTTGTITMDTIITGTIITTGTTVIPNATGADIMLPTIVRTYVSIVLQ